jgi:hypothetical protein
MTGWMIPLLLMTGPAVAAPADFPWPVHAIEIDAYWRLILPDREPFDASGLLRTPAGELLTLSDRGAEVYRVRCSTGTNVARLELHTQAFPESEMERLKRRPSDRFDIEGLAIDDQDRLYLVEEANRWILRWDPRNATVARLEVDWSPVEKYFNPNDRNASFEGVAFGAGRLYVANERDRGRILVVDPAARKVVNHFEVRTHRGNAWDTHYSDLSWHDGRLFVLLRESRAVLAVNPATHRVEAEFDFSRIEQSPEHRYTTVVPWVGVMEGLAVERDFIWLATDNNRLGRAREPGDTRPTLFRCRRPDRAGP